MTNETITESSIELRGMVEGTTGREWEIKVIAPGVSKNGVLYTPDVLKAALPLYEGAYSYERHSANERGFRERIGRVHSPVYESRNGDEGVWARLRVINPTVREMLLEAVDAGELATIGFSHDVVAAIDTAVVDGRRVRRAKSIEAVNSVDMVERPSAGGRMARLVAGDLEVELDPEEMKKLMQEQVAEAVAAAMKTTLPTLVSGLKEAIVGAPAKPEATETKTETATEAASTLTEAANAAKLALREAVVEKQRNALERRLAETKLSTPGKAMVKRQFEDAVARRTVEDTEVEAIVKEWLDYEGLFHAGESRPVGNAGIRFEAGATGREKFMADLYATYAGPHEKLAEGAKPFRSLREAYVKFTGNWDVDYETMMEDWAVKGGYRSGRDHKRISESITTASWGEINADVMFQRLIKAYSDMPEYSQWRLFVSDYDSVNDFRARHWMRFGGYGNLPAVTEGSTYQPTTSPTDEEVTFTVSKRGMLEDITMESIANDQVGVVRRIPNELGRAAARTLYNFVMDMITTDNANVDYDSTALYHTNHANTGTTALSVAGLNTTVIAMRDQTAYNQSLEILGGRNKPKYIIVPNELTARARRIVDPSDAYTFALSSTPDADTSIDPQHFKGKGMEVVTYDKLTDATDWWLVADPNEVPTIVMGFLNGRQEPELFVQDSPTVGSVFTSDKTTFKIRHVYGGDVLDHRSFYRQVVAG